MEFHFEYQWVSISCMFSYFFYKDSIYIYSFHYLSPIDTWLGEAKYVILSVWEMILL